MGWFFMLCAVELADVVGFKRATLTEAKSYWLSKAQMQHFSSGASRAGSWGGSYLIRSRRCRRWVVVQAGP